MNPRTSFLRSLRYYIVAMLVVSPIAFSFAQQRDALPLEGNGSYRGHTGMMADCDEDCMGEGMGGTHMMSGYGCGAEHVGWDPGLKLSHDQQIRMNAIVEKSRKALWQLMGKILDEQSTLRSLYASSTHDQTAIDTSYAAMRDLRKQMRGISLDEHKRINELLTREQRERLRDY